MSKLSECELVWHGDYPAAAVDRVRKHLAEDSDLEGIDNPAELCLRVVPTGKFSYDGPFIHVRGEHGSEALHCEYRERADWIMPAQRPVFYDCEATCLGGLPIEIGWAGPLLGPGSISSEGHLIKPPAHWDLDPVWDPDAERLHGIRREDLIARGRTPLEIAEEMNSRMKGRPLYSDSPVDDARWLRMIFDEAKLRPMFSIETTNANLLIEHYAVERKLSREDIEQVKAKIPGISPKMHRAEADARSLAAFWQAIEMSSQGRIRV